ncbi:FAD-binding oxidoreductase/lyase [Leucobacter soli]|uniref:hypothetical protein n=1 Tax=Leucobacter soli TaxID=2812850 RepID=UPI0036143C95
MLAGGDGMPDLGRHFGIELPISSGAVQVSVTERIDPLVKHLVYYAGGKLTFKQAQAGTLLIGGGWPARQNAAGEWVLNPESLRTNLGIATRVAPWSRTSSSCVPGSGSATARRITARSSAPCPGTRT